MDVLKYILKITPVKIALDILIFKYRNEIAVEFIYIEINFIVTELVWIVSVYFIMSLKCRERTVNFLFIAFIILSNMISIKFKIYSVFGTVHVPQIINIYDILLKFLFFLGGIIADFMVIKNSDLLGVDKYD